MPEFWKDTEAFLIRYYLLVIFFDVAFRNDRGFLAAFYLETINFINMDKR